MDNTSHGVWNPGCELNPGVHNPQPQEMLSRILQIREQSCLHSQAGDVGETPSSVQPDPDRTRRPEGPRDGTCFPGDLGEEPFQTAHAQGHFP